MDQAVPTPPQRRQGRNDVKSSSQKIYASENDASGVRAVDFVRASQPFTPRKASSGTPEPSSAAERSATAKPPRSRNNKNRAKNTATSPEVPQPQSARRTPPSSVAAVKTNSTAAFAGATFHASPAPSALPLPSFHRAHAGSPRAQEAHQSRHQQPSPPSTESGAPTPQRNVPASQIPQESPLEAMFRADRAEKEKARRASFAHPFTAEQGPISPPSTSHYEPPATVHQFNSYSRGRPTPQRNHSGIPLSELDGTPELHLGPAFSTPYQDRIRAAHLTSRNDPTIADEHRSFQAKEDPSEALKKYLFGPKTKSDEPPPQAPEASLAKDTDRPPGLLAMEDDLRRILKLT